MRPEAWAPMGLKYLSSTAFQACVVQVRRWGWGARGDPDPDHSLACLSVLPTNEQGMAPAYQLLRPRAESCLFSASVSLRENPGS